MKEAVTEAIKEARNHCKTLQRNGFEAYVINPILQIRSQVQGESIQLDIATDTNIDELIKLFPEIQAPDEPYLVGMLEQDDITYRFYHADVVEGSHPETSIARVTPRSIKHLAESETRAHNLACPYMPPIQDGNEGFGDFSSGEVILEGLPDETLRRNHLLGIRAMRMAANYNLPIEANTWLAILRGARNILDYVSVSDIMDEWRKVEAENLWKFAEFLFESQIMHGLVPEVAALSRLKQPKGENGELVTVLSHTLETMKFYPEVLPYDWYGTMALFFHDVGKLYTAEYCDGKWCFYQHANIGAKVTRRILNRLRFASEDTDLICHLVRYHMRFNLMLTDKGIRSFKALDEYPRLIEMVRANIKAGYGSYASFNHNIKMIERADIPEEMLEPLLNGNEIMDFTGLKPGPAVGIIRDALLKAQVKGDVTSIHEAVIFVRKYTEQERLT